MVHPRESDAPLQGAAPPKAFVLPNLPRALRGLLAFALFVAAYQAAFVSARAFAPAIASPFWFPDSILLCALLLSPRRWWWVFLLGTLPGRIAPAITPKGGAVSRAVRYRASEKIVVHS